MPDPTDIALVESDALDRAIEQDLIEGDAGVAQQDSTLVDMSQQSGTPSDDTSLIHQVFGTPQPDVDDDIDDAEEDAQEDETPKKKLSRRERRVVNLKKRLDKAEKDRQDTSSKFEQLQQAYAGLYRHNEQVSKQFQQTQTVLAGLQGEVKSLRELGTQKGSEDESQAALNKFQRETVDQTQALVDPKIRKLEKELSTLHGKLHEQQRATKLAAKQQRLNADADKLVDKVLLGPNFPKEIRDQVLDDYGTTLHKRMQLLLLQEAYMRQAELGQVVEDVVPFLKAWAFGHYLAQTKGAGDKVAEGQKRISSGSGARGAANKKPRPTPTQAEAEEAGYDTPLDMIVAQDMEP